MKNRKLHASELRIGNLIDKNGIIEAVTADDILDLHLSGDNPLKPYHRWSGVKNSDYWMKRFGFQVDTPMKKAYIGQMKWNTDLRGIWPCNWIGQIEPCVYVHEMQNLYYAIERKELILKNE